MRKSEKFERPFEWIQRILWKKSIGVEVG